VRYYVVCRSDLDGIAPHIIAEVVRDSAEEDDEHTTLASALTDERRVIATRPELLAHPLGFTALEAWESDDDSAYDDECAARRAGHEGTHRGLRLVWAARAD
jgi:hypothetical protein